MNKTGKPSLLDSLTLPSTEAPLYLEPALVEELIALGLRHKGLTIVAGSLAVRIESTQRGDAEYRGMDLRIRVAPVPPAPEVRER